jgi:hypothetical protein
LITEETMDAEDQSRQAQHEAAEFDAVAAIVGDEPQMGV